MSKFLIKWQLNPLMTPADPEERAKLWLSMLEMVKAELNSGESIDWGEYCDASGGYSISEGNDADLFTGVLRWMPYIIFDVKPVLTVDQVMESVKKAAVGKKTK